VSKHLYEARAKAWAEVQELQARMSADGYTPNAEDNAALERGLADVDARSQAIELSERASKLDSAFGQNGGAVAPTPTRAAEVDKEAAYRDAFGAYLRRGEAALAGDAGNILATRAQETSPGSAGGYLIPTTTLNRMTEALKAFGGIMGHANVITTGSGNPLNWPSNDDTSNVGAILAEGDEVTETALTFGQKTLGSHTYTSKLILVSWQLLQDSMFDVESFVARKAGERIGRAVAAHLATGTGSGQPQGLFTGATASGVTGAVGATAAVSYQNIVDLVHSIDPAYRDRGRFVMSDGMLKLIRSLLDGNDRPLWQPSIIPGEPSTILGYPYTVDNGVAAPAPTVKSLGFGDVNLAYVVRQVSGGTLVTMREAYAKFLQNGYFAFLRLDAKVDDASAFKTFAHGAAA
jgi:HK97 family phage major capsid protein